MVEERKVMKDQHGNDVKDHYGNDVFEGQVEVKDAHGNKVFRDASVGTGADHVRGGPGRVDTGKKDAHGNKIHVDA